jgi:hypothetical protein
MKPEHSWWSRRSTTRLVKQCGHRHMLLALALPRRLTNSQQQLGSDRAAPTLFSAAAGAGNRPGTGRGGPAAAAAPGAP